MRIGRISVSVEPWVHTVPSPNTLADAESVELRFSIQIGNWEPFHMTEVLAHSDFESRFEYYLKNVKHKIETLHKAGIEGRLTIEDGKLMIDGKEVSRW